MIFKLQQNFLAIITISCATAFVGCGSTSSTTTGQANAARPSATIESKTTETNNKGAGNVETKTVEKTTIETKNGEPNKTTYENSTNLTASSVDKIGVPECDDYIEKYEACVMGKVPEAARMTMQSSIDQMRQSWKQVAANPQAKATLASGCKQARDASKQAMSAYACDW